MTTEDKAKTPEQRIDALEEAVGTILDMLESISKKVDEVDRKTVKKAAGLFGGKRTKTAIKDTKTGKVYSSKAATGKALYAEVENGDPGDHFLWYKLQAAYPDRFVEASEEETNKVWEDERIAREKEVEESNKRLAAEEAKAKAEEAKAKK